MDVALTAIAEPAVTADAKVVVHSPKGASSAERWLNCHGSTHLIKLLGPVQEEDPDYRTDGTQAHALAAHCLETGDDAWMAMARYPRVTQEISAAVQLYVDYVRKLDGRLYIENTIAHPEFHPDAYGTLDACAIDIDPSTVQQDALFGELLAEFVDYKNGVGVVVEVEHNVQTMYYAFVKMDGPDWPEDLPRLPDDARIRLTIAQPRAPWHRDGVIRSWDTTAGELREWAYTELLPAMEAEDITFSMGDWCRFCKTKLVCPKMRNLASDAALAAIEMSDKDTLPVHDDGWVSVWYGRIPQLKMFITAIEARVKYQMAQGVQIAGAKMVYGLVDRVWKDGAPIETEFKDKAWKPAQLISPAAAEKLPGGKDFVAEWAMKPPAPLVVAPVADKRAAVSVQTDAEAFAKAKLDA